MFIVIAKGKTRKYQGEYEHKMKLNPYLPQPMAQKKKKKNWHKNLEQKQWILGLNNITASIH